MGKRNNGASADLGRRMDPGSKRAALHKLEFGIDMHVGQRVRARRLELGMSQIQLAGALGVSFQQIQKNERASNRMGQGRIYRAAVALGVPVSYFFDGLPADLPGLAKLTKSALKTAREPRDRENRSALLKAIAALPEGKARVALHFCRKLGAPA